MRWILYIISYCSRLGRSSAILQKVELPVALYWCAWWCQPHGCPVTVQIADMAAKETLKEHYTNCSFNFTRDCPNDICLAGAITTDTLHRPIILIHNERYHHHHHQRQWTRASYSWFISWVDVHQSLHCSRITDRGGNIIHVHYFHSSDQNRFRPAATMTSVFIRSPQLTPVANSISRYDQSQWIPRMRIPQWTVESIGHIGTARRYHHRITIVWIYMRFGTIVLLKLFYDVTSKIRAMLLRYTYMISVPTLRQYTMMFGCTEATQLIYNAFRRGGKRRLI